MTKSKNGVRPLWRDVERSDLVLRVGPGADRAGISGPCFSAKIRSTESGEKTTWRPISKSGTIVFSGFFFEPMTVFNFRHSEQINSVPEIVPEVISFPERGVSFSGFGQTAIRHRLLRMMTSSPVLSIKIRHPVFRMTRIKSDGSGFWRIPPHNRSLPVG